MPVKHYHHHYHFHYFTSIKRQFSALGAIIVVLIVVLLMIFSLIMPRVQIDVNQLSFSEIFLASLATFLRLTIAYIFSLILAIPLALLITSTPKLERILLPVFDILQSVPVLAFFPIVVLVFIKINFFNGAAIFILFLSMLWNLVFNMISGLKTIPQDIKSVATIFGAKGLKKVWFITLPAIFPHIVSGSLLAWAQGWSIVIVAEVLHSYIPNSSTAYDLLGLGSLLVNAISFGKTSVFLVSLVMMITIISLINFFVWQKLLRISERFKFD